MSNETAALVFAIGLFLILYPFTTLPLLRRLLRKPLRLHRWSYRNPYERRCLACGRHEVMHTWNTAPPSGSWWEVFDDGDASVKPCGKKGDES